jgi:hypothetical protein
MITLAFGLLGANTSTQLFCSLPVLGGRNRDKSRYRLLVVALLAQQPKVCQLTATPSDVVYVLPRLTAELAQPAVSGNHRLANSGRQGTLWLRVSATDNQRKPNSDRFQYIRLRDPPITNATPNIAHGLRNLLAFFGAIQPRLPAAHVSWPVAVQAGKGGFHFQFVRTILIELSCESPGLRFKWVSQIPRPRISISVHALPSPEHQSPPSHD